MEPSVTIAVDLPAAVAGGRSPIELADELRSLAVVLAWQRGDLSVGKAARMLGMNRVQFHDWLLARNLPTTNYGVEEFRADMATLAEFTG